MVPRLRLLLARVRELRENLYPEGWAGDPLNEVEQELKSLLRAYPKHPI